MVTILMVKSRGLSMLTNMGTRKWRNGTMNDAPLEQKIEGMEKFYNEIICKLK